MRPLRITTVPDVGSLPSPVATVPPVMAMVCAAAGAYIWRLAAPAAVKSAIRAL